MKRFVAGLVVGIALAAATGTAIAAYPNLFPRPGQQVLWLGPNSGPFCGSFGPGHRKVSCAAGQIQVVFTATTVTTYSPTGRLLFTVRRVQP